VWRQPPWGLPSGRRPLGRGAPLVPGVLHLPLCIYGFPVVASEWLVPSDGVGVPLWLRLWATVVVGAWVTWTAAGGITVLATAFTRHRASLASGSWWGANSASAAWYGTALLGAVASGVALAYGMLQGHPSANPDLALLNVAIPAAMLGSLLPALSCVLVARGYSNREVKRTILAGQAPAYWISPDTLCWWDGAQWIRVSTAAPDGALRSPDGSYWWTGHSWFALPPRPRRRRGVAGVGTGVSASV